VAFREPLLDTRGTPIVEMATSVPDVIDFVLAFPSRRIVHPSRKLGAQHDSTIQVAGKRHPHFAGRISRPVTFLACESTEFKSGRVFNRGLSTLSDRVWQGSRTKLLLYLSQ